jgi:formate dehydrogenase maturation protein FdhE
MLQNHDLQEIFEEIKSCRQLYPEFENAQVLVTNLFKAKDTFFKKQLESRPKTEVTLTEEGVQEKLSAGSPLIADPVVDKKTFTEFCKVVAATIAKKEPSLKDAMTQLESFVTEYFARTAENTVSVRDMPDFIAELVKKTPLKPDLATFIITFMLPSLFGDYYNLDNLENINAALWEKGNCPVCGVEPHYGLLKDKEGVRMLECWLCGFQRVFPRIKCPYCLNTEQAHLGFFTVGDSERCRVHFCKKCDSYVKIFDLRSSINEDAFLPVHNLATLSYDLFALKEGFKPGSGLLWVNEEEHNHSAN